MENKGLVIAAIAVLGFYWLLPRLLTAKALAMMLFRRIRTRQVSAESLSADELTLLHYHDAALTEAGFEPMGLARMQAFLSRADVEIAMAVWRHQSDPIWCTVSQALLPEADRIVNIEFDTQIAGQARLSTSHYQLDNAALPPLVQGEAHSEFSPAQLLERHRARLAGRRPGEAIYEQALDDRLARSELEVRWYVDALRARGVAVATRSPDFDRPSILWLLRGADAMVRLARRRASLAKKRPLPYAASDLPLRVRADRVALHIHQADSRIATDERYAARWLFVFGALLFWGVAALVWDPRFAALLVVVLAFHEAGHALMMMRFGYRDVSVFFIPMLGALATAKPAAINAVRRSIVLLAGPMPGIVLALVLLLVAPEWSHLRLNREFLLILVYLNAFNLLPLTPLDGGQVIQLIAGDHRQVTLALQILGAAGLLALGWYLTSPLAAIMGAFLGWAIYSRRSFARFSVEALGKLKDQPSPDRTIEVVSQLTTEPPYVKWRFGTRLALCNALNTITGQVASTAWQRGNVLMLYLASAAITWLAYERVSGL